MTDQQHPITPPPELVEQWTEEYWGFPARGRTECESYTEIKFLVTQAARWGYEQRGAVNEAKLQKARDEELEACCEYIAGPGKWFINSEYRVSELRAARRPKPPSLKEQALALIETVEISQDACSSWDFSVVRRALEALDD